MSSLDFDLLSVPDGIKKSLKILNASYAIEKYDQKGGIGFTFFGQNRVLATDVAIKYYYWGGNPNFHVEPQALTRINSPNVLTVHDAGYADHEYAYFITSFCHGGDLGDLLTGGPIGNVKALDLVSQVLSGLSHLHQARFVHRDIKPLNIFLDDELTAVIGDFGSLKRVPEGASPSYSPLMLA